MALIAPVKNTLLIVVLYPVFSLRVHGGKVIGLTGVIMWNLPIAIN
tara:strand:- start:53 stop:190 length:138 start_codon:yes stop_codon:yes gene_type:complete